MRRRKAFGGSQTDPFTKGHLEVLKAVCSSGLFDDVIWFPSGFSSWKPNSLNAEHRATMAIIGVPQAWLVQPPDGWANLEIRLVDVYNDDTPTYIRLLNLQDQYPDDQITFFTGSDAVTIGSSGKLPIAEWNHSRYLLNEKILLLPRKGFAQPGDVILPPNFTWLDVELPEIASSTIRKMITNGEKGWEQFVPDNIALYIKRHRLYGYKE